MNNFQKLIFLCFATLSISACNNPFKNKFEAEFCWSESTKKSEYDVVKQNIDLFAVNAAKKYWTESGLKWTPTETEKVKKMLKYKISNHYVKYVSEDGNSIACGATVNVVINAGTEEKTALSTTSNMVFDLYKSENNTFTTIITEGDLIKLKALMNIISMNDSLQNQASEYWSENSKN